VKSFIAENEKWFFEKEVPYDAYDVMVGLKLKKKLYSGKSSFQKIEVYDTFAYGKILVLDGILQTSEKDEFVYHEMLCHLPLFLHKNPERVLILGGGDGGSLKEVLKHKIKKVWMVEIDKKVVEISKKYIPSISGKSFNNKRAEIIFEDGKEFIKKYNDFFDVIIFDLSDPAGPAEGLISGYFYKSVKRALRKNGIISIQSGSLNDQPKLASLIFKRTSKIFPYIEMHRAVVPSYYAGEYAFNIASSTFDFRKITFKKIEKKYKKLKLDLRYYSPEIHSASKVLPRYLRDKIKKYTDV
jgi:spermidine synthase